MAEYPAVRNQNRCPTHPGAALDDWLFDVDITKTKLADMLGISRQQLYDILTEKKPVSANIAVRIGKLLGNGPVVWLRMQAAHDAWHAERNVDVSNIPTLEISNDNYNDGTYGLKRV